MSKHRPPRTPSAAAGVTSESSSLEILGAKIRLQTEILRRQHFADLQALEARLAAMPPLPSQDETPANEG